MKKILVSLLIIGAVAAIAIGGTIAYFSDTETSSGNTFTASILDLKVNGVDGNPDLGVFFTLADLEPSVVQYTAPIVLTVNRGTGDNPVKLYKKIEVESCDTGNVTEPECTEQNGTWDNNGYECSGWSTDKNDIDGDTWFDLKIPDVRWIIEDGEVKVNELQGKWIYLGQYVPTDSVTLIQSFHLDGSVGNWAQGDNCTLKETFMAQQANAPDPDNCYNCP